MPAQIEGLHHVTSIASDARAIDGFFTGVLGLRRVKKTVNFDAPDVYHLYYGDALGRPGSAMTYFPFPGARRGSPGAGEAAITAFAIPLGAIAYWQERFARHGIACTAFERFGEARLAFDGPDGDGFALVEQAGDARHPWTGGGIAGDVAIRGFHSVQLRLRSAEATRDLLHVMGYGFVASDGAVTRLAIPAQHANGADVVEILVDASLGPAVQGAGSVHHVAFAVADDATQDAIRTAIANLGIAATPQIDRDYFRSIYFRSPGGVLFEIATNDPGFTRDEPADVLGQALKLPSQHEHLRQHLAATLVPLD